MNNLEFRWFFGTTLDPTFKLTGVTQQAHDPKGFEHQTHCNEQVFGFGLLTGAICQFRCTSTGTALLIFDGIKKKSTKHKVLWRAFSFACNTLATIRAYRPEQMETNGKTSRTHLSLLAADCELINWISSVVAHRGAGSIQSDSMQAARKFSGPDPKKKNLNNSWTEQITNSKSLSVRPNIRQSLTSSNWMGALSKSRDRNAIRLLIVAWWMGLFC